MNKLQIALCDDERPTREYLKEILTNWAKTRSAAIEILEYTSAEDFLCDENFPDIALLDIQMGEMDGMELARQIRKNNESIEIIFVTGYPDYAAEGYEVAALNYLLKPVSEEKLWDVLDRAAYKLAKPANSLLVQTADARLKIPFGKILYIESFAHYVQINIATGESVETRANISDLADKLGDGFFRCHRSYVASLRHVSRINRTDIVLDGGRTIPLSRRLYKDANMAFINFHKADRGN